MLAQAWIFDTLVHVYALSVVIDLVLEARFAVAVIASDAGRKNMSNLYHETR
jgi:hypothetical protein